MKSFCEITYPFITNSIKVGPSHSKCRIKKKSKHPVIFQINGQKKIHLHQSYYYSGESIYEWNIDGLTKHQILQIIQNISMAISAFKVKDHGDRERAQLLIYIFSKILKNWWDNYLNQDKRNYILTATKQVTIDSASSRTTKVTGQEVVMTISEPGFVATLIYAIYKHFIGDPNKLQEKSLEILIKLTCPKLQDFR